MPLADEEPATAPGAGGEDGGKGSASIVDAIEALKGVQPPVLSREQTRNLMLGVIVVGVLMIIGGIEVWSSAESLHSSSLTITAQRSVGSEGASGSFTCT